MPPRERIHERGRLWGDISKRRKIERKKGRKASLSKKKATLRESGRQTIYIKETIYTKD